VTIHELPPPDKFWERPEPKSRGDDNEETIYIAQGRSLHRWEMLESFFAIFFGYLVQSQSLAARRAYGSIASARGRRDAIRAAAEIFFINHAVSKQDQERFDKLMRHFESASGRRNEIAHSVLMNVADLGWFILPPEYNTNKTLSGFKIEKAEYGILEMLPGKYRYTSADITHFYERFDLLRTALFSYMQALQQAYAQGVRQPGR
jgi:hypothetical protein